MSISSSSSSAAAFFALYGTIKIHIKTMSGEIITLKHQQTATFEELAREVYDVLPDSICPRSVSLISLSYEGIQLPMTTEDTARLVDGATYDLYIMNMDDWKQHLRKTRGALFK